MGTIGAIHVIFAVLAIALGGVIFAIPKGTQLHRALGYGYVVSMLGLNATAFFIYRLFNGFGVFHVLALISLATVIAGFVPAWLKRPRGRWLVNHYRGICWSYVGLLAAALAEAAVRLPLLKGTWWHFGITAFVASFAACFVGGYFIATREQSTIAKVTTPPQTMVAVATSTAADMPVE